MNLFYCHIDTPAGPLMLSGTEDCLHRVSFAHGRRPCLPESNWTRDWSMLEYAINPIIQYFTDQKPPRINHELNGSPFQVSVWEYLKTVPIGETVTYGEVARAIGKRGASLAVAAACAENPLILVVPCHRVLTTDGAFSGFCGGLAVQHTLLRHEGVRSMEDQLDLFDPLEL